MRSLRICGILMCATEGIEITTKCPCFLSLAKDKAKEQLEEALGARLNVLTQCQPIDRDSSR